jgi:hypothetical protein
LGKQTLEHDCQVRSERSAQYISSTVSNFQGGVFSLILEITVATASDELVPLATVSWHERDSQHISMSECALGSPARAHSRIHISSKALVGEPFFSPLVVLKSRCSKPHIANLFEFSVTSPLVLFRSACVPRRLYELPIFTNLSPSFGSNDAPFYPRIPIPLSGFGKLSCVGIPYIVVKAGLEFYAEVYSRPQWLSARAHTIGRSERHCDFASGYDSNSRERPVFPVLQ